MNTGDIKHLISASTVSLRNGIYTARWGFFYRMGKSTETCRQKVIDAIPGAEIVEAYEHYAAFRGGAPLSRSSHWCVKFRIKEN